MPLVSRHGFPTGAFPTPRHKLLAAMPNKPLWVPPPQWAFIPKKYSYKGNNQYGDCVSAEEAASIGAYSVMCGAPERFVTDQTTIQWASKGGFLNGANLTDVMDAMAKSGMTDDASDDCKDGPYTAVDYGNETLLQAALVQGPVKIGMASSSLPSGAGNVQGWLALTADPSRDEDHCTALWGYGSPQWLAQQLMSIIPGCPTITIPSNAPPVAYLHYTWATVGIVSHDWLMGTCGEAWIRNPSTLGLTPKPPVNPIPWGI